MAKRNALGKGIEALIGEANIEIGEDSAFSSENQNFSAESSVKSPKSLPNGIEIDENGEFFVDIELLRPNPHQMRRNFDSEKLEELSQSLKIDGILQPITIEDANDGTFFIIAGERRFRAAKLAGLKKIPVRLKKYDDQKKLELALIENIQRENLNAIEEARAYESLMQMTAMTQEKIANRVGKKRSTISNAIRLLNLPEEMQNAISKNEISAGHARALLSVLSSENQTKLFQKIKQKNLSVRDSEIEAAILNDEAKKSSPKNDLAKKNPSKVRDADFVDIEQQFINSLGTKVSLKGDFNRGSITIEYFSRADLDKFYTLITGKEA